METAAWAGCVSWDFCNGPHLSPSGHLASIGSPQTPGTALALVTVTSPWIFLGVAQVSLPTEFEKGKETKARE